MKRAEKQLDVGQVLSVIEKFNAALDLLDDYDHQTMKKPTGSKAVYVLDYGRSVQFPSTRYDNLKQKSATKMSSSGQAPKWAESKTGKRRYFAVSELFKK